MINDYEVWRVNPAHLPPINTDERPTYSAWQRRFGREPGQFERLRNGIRLRNRGKTPRIFRFANTDRAYYLTGGQSQIVPYDGLSDEQIRNALVHRIPRRIPVTTVP